MSVVRNSSVRPVFTLILSTLVASMAQNSANAELRLEGQLWAISVEGDGAVGDNGVPGTRLDLERDFGYTDDEIVFGGTVLWGDRHQLGASYFQVDISASTQFDEPVKFDNLVFSPGIPVESSLEATLLRAFYRYSAGSDAFRIGPIVGFHYFDISSRASSPQIGSASAEIRSPMPIVGAFLETTATDWLRFQLSGVGLTGDFDDVSASFYDVEAFVLVGWKSYFLAGGYRHVFIDGEDDSQPTDAEITFKGPVGMIGFRW